MEEEQEQLAGDFPLFSTRKPPPKHTNIPPQPPQITSPQFEKQTTTTTNPNSSFSQLVLSDWALRTIKELGLKTPTPVQQSCIPRIIAGDDVLGIAQTGSGKTAAFALPILHKLAEDPFGVFGLVITPTRELAYQLAEQFRALGSCLNLRCLVVVGGMDSLTQAHALMQRPHIVIATPGRIKALINANSDIASVFSKTKFLVLDEADRVLEPSYEDELRVVFQCLPKNRQTLLFSATMTSDLRALLELSQNKVYFFEAYEGLETVESLKQQYILIPKNVKDVYLLHILSKMGDMGIRSAIVFVSTCRSCHLLSVMLEELDLEVAALHSYKSQSLRLSALHRFKSGQVPILLATDVASRGLDIPTVDLVLNYDIPRFPKDYVHRVGRTARAGRGGLSVSFVTQAGTQFWDENMQNELAEGRLSGTAFDRYCMVLFAGIAAEALVYGEADGGENDENLFRSISIMLDPPLSVAQMSNQARWSVLQSYNLLKWHKHAHRAAVKALEDGGGLSTVIREIEEAMVAGR